ncbi:MAG TPA: glycoside hydrolase domain-containing protein [Anaeromyxobacter sp.]|nr:glycoside hydrolase domain-containing protein [Anaeromyxobacter sp.]
MPPEPRPCHTRSPRRLLFLLLAGLFFAPAAARAVQVFTASSLEKIRPTAQARSAASAALSAARNEYDAFQVVVTGPASAVRAQASSLTGPATIGPVRLFREALINLAHPSGPDGGTGWFPDALVPDVDELVGEERNAFPFDVPAGESRAIWAEVLVPPGAPAGDYHGTVTVTFAGGAVEVPVSLHVWPFSLPATSSLKSAFGFSFGAIPAAHGLSAGDAFSTLRARYGQLALDHRLTLSHVDDGDTSCGHVDEYYGPSLDGTAGTELSGAEMTAFQLMGSASQWAPYFAGQGWSDRLFQYTCDEPPQTCAFSDIPTRAAAARAANPPIRTLVTTTVKDADAQGVTSSIDILVPVINDLDDRPGASQFSGDQRPSYDAFLAGSSRREVWTYQSCMSHGCGGTSAYFAGWASYMIDASAVRNRAMQWLAFNFRVSGELYYETAMAYSHDPWNNQWDFNGNGDGTLFYPGTPAQIGGTTHIPVASIRLKEIRAGMQDYEYLKLVSDLGDPDLASSIATGLFPHPYATEVSPDALLAARAQLAARIVELLGGEDPTPGPGPAPDPTPSPSPAPSPSASAASRHGCGSGGAAGAPAALLFSLALLLRRRPRPAR